MFSRDEYNSAAEENRTVDSRASRRRFSWDRIAGAKRGKRLAQRGWLRGFYLEEGACGALAICDRMVQLPRPSREEEESTQSATHSSERTVSRSGAKAFFWLWFKSRPALRPWLSAAKGSPHRQYNQNHHQTISVIQAQDTCSETRCGTHLSNLLSNPWCDS